MYLAVATAHTAGAENVDEQIAATEADVEAHPVVALGRIYALKSRSSVTSAQREKLDELKARASEKLAYILGALDINDAGFVVAARERFNGGQRLTDHRTAGEVYLAMAERVSAFHRQAEQELKDRAPFFATLHSQWKTLEVHGTELRAGLGGQANPEAKLVPSAGWMIATNDPTCEKAFHTSSGTHRLQFEGTCTVTRSVSTKTREVEYTEEEPYTEKVKVGTDCHPVYMTMQESRCTNEVNGRCVESGTFPVQKQVGNECDSFEMRDEVKYRKVKKKRTETAGESVRWQWSVQGTVKGTVFGTPVSVFVSGSDLGFDDVSPPSGLRDAMRPIWNAVEPITKVEIERVRTSRTTELTAQLASAKDPATRGDALARLAFWTTLTSDQQVELARTLQIDAPHSNEAIALVQDIRAATVKEAPVTVASVTPDTPANGGSIVEHHDRPSMPATVGQHMDAYFHARAGAQQGITGSSAFGLGLAGILQLENAGVFANGLIPLADGESAGWGISLMRLSPPKYETPLRIGFGLTYASEHDSDTTSRVFAGTMWLFYAFGKEKSGRTGLEFQLDLNTLALYGAVADTETKFPVPFVTRLHLIATGHTYLVGEAGLNFGGERTLRLGAMLGVRL